MNALILGMAALGFLHTVVGPDHYLPIIGLAKTHSWNFKKTALITLACGGIHIVMAVVVGWMGKLLSFSVTQAASFQALQGKFLVCLLVSTGILYLVKALRDPYRTSHSGSFIIIALFVVGPCEPLIPILVLPSLSGGAGVVAFAVFVYGISTILTMLGIVLSTLKMTSFVPLSISPRGALMLSGLLLISCGVGVQCIGL